MKNPLDSLWARDIRSHPYVDLYNIIKYALGKHGLHTTRIGPLAAYSRRRDVDRLLYYFNFVQVDALKAAAADNTGRGITSTSRRALLYFAGPRS